METVVPLTATQPSETPPETTAPTPSVTMADPYVWQATEATPALEAKAKAENPPVEPQAKPALKVPGVPKGLVGDVLTAAVVGGAMVATLVYARRPRHAF